VLTPNDSDLHQAALMRRVHSMTASLPPPDSVYDNTTTIDAFSVAIGVAFHWAADYIPVVSVWARRAESHLCNSTRKNLIFPRIQFRI